MLNTSGECQQVQTRLSDRRRMIRRGERKEEEGERKAEKRDRKKQVAGMSERSAKSPAQCRKKMQKEKREFVGKDLLLGKGTVSFQAINKGTLWGQKEEGQ